VVDGKDANDFFRWLGEGNKLPEQRFCYVLALFYFLEDFN
jgi:hypothetical protein